jgi:uncharacterized protein
MSFLINATKNIALYALFTLTSANLLAQTALSTALSSPDAKRALAVRVVAMQQGPEMDRLLSQLARSAATPLVASWEQRVNALPAAKQEAAAKAIDTQLQTFGDAAVKALRSQMDAVSANTLVPAYMERFSEEELRQLSALLEAPVFKKYQSASPELGTLLVRGLADATRADVQALAKDFDAAATKAVGAEPAPKAVPRTSAGTAAAPVKKP